MAVERNIVLQEVVSQSDMTQEVMRYPRGSRVTRGLRQAASNVRALANKGHVRYDPSHPKHDGLHLVIPFQQEHKQTVRKIDPDSLNIPIPIEELSMDDDPFYRKPDRNQPHLNIHLGRREKDGKVVMLTRDREGNTLPEDQHRPAEAKVPLMEQVLPLKELLMRKAESGQRVVFVIPGLNEGIPDKNGKSNMRTTLENLAVLRQKYNVNGKIVSLVDQIIVADNSPRFEERTGELAKLPPDQTREIAEELGLQYIYVPDEVEKRYGEQFRKEGKDLKKVRGKGVNMRIATEIVADELREENVGKQIEQRVEEDDVILAYLDSDFGILPGQAMSTISPLVAEQNSIQGEGENTRVIKNRNVRMNLLWMLRRTYAGDHEAMEKHKDPKSGGRATEFALRPMLRKFRANMQYNQQPICGAYAMRLATAVQVPFDYGYGIETEFLTKIDSLNRLRNKLINVDIDGYNRQLLLRHRAGEMNREEYIKSRKERIPNYRITQTPGGLKVQEGQDNNAIGRMVDTILQTGLGNLLEEIEEGEGFGPKIQPYRVEYPLHNHSDPVKGDKIIVDQRIVYISPEKFEAYGQDPSRTIQDPVFEERRVAELERRRTVAKKRQDVIERNYIPLFDPDDELIRLHQRLKEKNAA